MSIASCFNLIGESNMIWTKSDIRNARKKPLPLILSHNGYRLRKLNDDNFNIENLPGIIVKHNYWFDKINKTGGNTIDFFVKFEKKSFQDTMKLIMEK